ncbi:hypothetical protein [Streptomyces longispororuber]|uniref:hypothetical protein n=1 Tax=Streptomyces longispororuber TaxID=68230 RepID=UPI0036F7A9A3
MAEGLQAGRLEVPVVADLTGFVRELRTKVEEAAAGLAAKVKIKVNDKNLRGKLEAAVEKASRGLSATVHVKVDDTRLRAELDSIARRIADSDLRIPVRPDDGGGSRSGGLAGRVRSLISGAQGEADRSPVNVPVQMRLPRGRRTLRMLGIGALLALVQPAVAALTQYGAGLTALVSAAAPAVGVLGAIPGLIAATGTAALGTVVAFHGFRDAVANSAEAQKQLAAGGKLTETEQKKLKQSLDELSPSARKIVGDILDVSSAWSKVRQTAQESFFSKLTGQIKPAAQTLIPLLSRSLGDASGQMGNLIKRGAQFMKTGVFRSDFKTIAGTNNRVIGHMVDGIANLGRASMDFLVASGPFTERVGRGVERVTQWARASVAAGRETGSLARFLDHAGDKAAQLGRSSVDLIKGLAGVGKAGQDSGNALLDGFEGAMTRFNRWANSKAGQGVMRQFFSDAAPTFHELNALVGDFVRGLGRAAKDGGITDMIRQIRTELMPALGAFFDAIGQGIGPALLSLISNVARAIGNLAGAGSGLGFVLEVLNGLLQAFNGVMNTVPGASRALAFFLGTLLALKVITSITGMMRNLGTSVVAAGANFNRTAAAVRAAGAIGPQITTWQRMSLAYQSASQQGGRLTGTLRGVAAANRAASTAAGGMVSAFGGPLGIAITGLTIGLGLLATRQERAARAAQAHEERVNSLSQALSASNGVIDANVRAQAAQLLQDTKLSDGKTKLVDTLRTAGVSLREVTDAYLEQDGTIGGLQSKLQKLADSNKEYVEHGRDMFVMDYSEQGKRYKAAADALGQVNGELDKTRKKQKEVADAINGASGTGTSSYDRLSSAVQNFNDKTKAADERVDALRRALNELQGNTQSLHDAQAQLNAVMLQIDDAMKSNIDRSDGWGRSLIASDGLVNTTTRNGQALNSQLTELRDSMLAVATRAKEAADGDFMSLAQAMDQSQGAMERARTKAIQLGTDMGLSKAQAKALADQMGFIPDTITTLMRTSGVDKAMGEFLGLRARLDSLKPGQTIRINAPTAEARRQLEALGFKVKTLPGGKKVSVSAPTGSARANIAALAADIKNAPSKKRVTVEAIIRKAAGELKDVRNKVADLPPNKKVKVDAPTRLAQQQLRELGFKIKGLKGKKVEITAPAGTASGQVAAIQSKINSLTGKTVHVTVQYSAKGKPYVNEHADGGIVRYAEGGIRRLGARVQAFARGTERHIAQIARPGEWRLWAEPETGGEAYIPLAPSKRKRSEAILDEVARQFGGRVVYFANGALRQHARGAPAAHRSSRTASRTAAAQGSSSLVGGDLNINVGAVSTVGDAMEDAMYELRKVRLGGGVA